jgi:hypothetical protein
VAVGTTRTFDTYVDGLNEVLRALRKLDKEATKELRVASRAIAEKHMAPAWRNAALNYAGGWGKPIADTVRTGSDRIPFVKIGANKKTLSGGASPTMVRYLSDKGNQGRAGLNAPKAFGTGTSWMANVKAYQGPAWQEWSEAVDRIVVKWSVL